MSLFSIDSDFVGVDLGSSAIRLVQVKKGSGSKPSLIAFGSVDVAPTISMSDSKLDLQNLAGSLSKLVKSTKISTKNVVSALSGSSVFSTVIKMPPMSQSELANAVKYQAEQNIPLKIEDVKLDWQIVRENPATGEKAVMIVAAPKTKIQRTLDIFEMAEMEVVYLETSPISVARALASPTDPLVMIVNIGGASTELSIVENGIVSHVRTLPAAGFSLTRVISQNLGLDVSQAEQFKRKFGLSQDKLEGQVFRTMKPIMNNITDEIQRSIKFYQEQYGGVVQKIILTGGGARMPELVTYLKSLLNLEVVFGNPWNKVNSAPEITEKLNMNSMEFTEAVGMAIREI